MEPNLQDKMKYQRFEASLIKELQQEIQDIKNACSRPVMDGRRVYNWHPNDKVAPQNMINDINAVIERHHNNIDILRQAFLNEHPDITEGRKILRHHNKYGAITA